MKNRQEDEVWLAKWLDGTLPEKERQEWERDPDFLSLHRVIKKMEHVNLPPYDVDIAYQKLREKGAETRRGRKVRLWPMAAAASVLVLIVVGLWIFYPSDIPNETGVAEQVGLKLPDGSVVQLNANSRIDFSKEEFEQNRMVELEGEAYFDVKEGSTFMVKTSEGNVIVLGTTFSVAHRGEVLEVRCFTGRVAVNDAQNVKNIEILEAGNAARIIDHDVTRRWDEEEGSNPSWLWGETDYEDEKLRWILDEMMNQYDIQITSPNVDLETRLTGTFGHDDLTTALQTITAPLLLEYEITGGQVTIK